MKYSLLFAAAVVCFDPVNAWAQERGPREYDPLPLELAYGADGPADFDRSALSPAQFKPAPGQQKWHFDFMLYGWFGTLNGDVGVNGHDVDVNVGPQQDFSHLQFTMAGRARLSHERWFAAIDVMYLGLAGSTDEPPVYMTFDQWIVQPTVGFSLTHHLDVFAGARYNQMNVEAAFQGPLGKQRSGLQEWWDPIIGGIFKGDLGKHFKYALYADVGGFGASSDLTTKLEPMISWYFNQHSSLDLAYQAYYVDYSNSADGFNYNTWTYGPLLGLSVHF